MVRFDSSCMFRREKDDLHYTMPITLKEALLGYDKVVQQLDGRKVKVKLHW